MRVDGLIVLVAVITTASSVEWISLRNAEYLWKKKTDCDNASRAAKLHNIQRRECKNKLPYMKAVVASAENILNVCQEVFHFYRWNCSSLATAPNLTPDLTRGTREQAYVYALAAAGLIHGMAKACSTGYVPECGCGELPTDNSHVWSGCNDNVEFGSNFARKFIENPLKGKAAKSRKSAPMNRHNYRVGRRLVSDSLKQECRCHGVSGSCTTRTCWQILPPLEEIGKRLKAKYETAVEVENKLVGAKMKLKPVNAQIPLRLDDLIYMAKSPDYCVKDEKMGSPGTYGRLCNETATDSSSCDSLCCGRGYVVPVTREEYKCNCKVEWCCDVKCEECNRYVEHFRCL